VGTEFGDQQPPATRIRGRRRRSFVIASVRKEQRGNGGDVTAPSQMEQSGDVAGGRSQLVLSTSAAVAEDLCWIAPDKRKFEHRQRWRSRSFPNQQSG
jgi:hypothetical protein